MRTNWPDWPEARKDTRIGVTEARHSVVTDEKPDTVYARDLKMGEIVRIDCDTNPRYNGSLAIKAFNGNLVSLLNGDTWCSGDLKVVRLKPGTKVTLTVDTFNR